MRNRLFIAIPIIALFALIIWRFVVNRNDKAAQAEAANARKNAPANVRVAAVIQRDIVHEFQGIGDVEAPADVRIAPKVTGRLDFLVVREGDRVTKGQVLARLDPTQAQTAVNQQQAAVASAQTNLAGAEVRLSRYYSLYKQGFVAAQDYDDQRTQRDVQRSALAAAQAQLRNIQAQLSDLVLTAPISGYITARFVDPGSIVSAGQAIVTVEAIRSIYVTTSVPDPVNQSISVGMEASVDFDTMPGRVFKGRVSQINTAADPQSRQFLVRAVIPNLQNVIRPGTYCRVTLVTKLTRGATVVPVEAVTSGARGSTVTVVDNKLVAHRRAVRTGDSDDTGIQILEGIAPGDRVVVLSSLPVRDGKLVRIDKGATQEQLPAHPAVVGGGGGLGTVSSSPSGGGAPAPTYGGSGAGAMASASSSSTNATAARAEAPNGAASSTLSAGINSSAGQTGAQPSAVGATAPGSLTGSASGGSTGSTRGGTGSTSGQGGGVGTGGG